MSRDKIDEKQLSEQSKKISKEDVKKMIERREKQIQEKKIIKK